jgi:hypothetical protein
MLHCSCDCPYFGIEHDQVYVVRCECGTHENACGYCLKAVSVTQCLDDYESTTAEKADRKTQTCRIRTNSFIAIAFAPCNMIAQIIAVNIPRYHSD